MKNLIEENSQIPELYQLRTKHNTHIKEMGYDYTDKMLQNSLSNVLYKNKNTNEFLEYLNKLMVTLYDGILPVRNLFFYTHNKYYNKHGK